MSSDNFINESKPELITIQIGNFSNFIGSHFWNIQEENYQYSKREQLQYEIDPEMLFRSNSNSCVLDKDIKYTPRLLLFDFKSNFGSMNSEGRVIRHSSSNIDNNDIFGSGGGSGSNVNTIIKQSTGKPIDRENKNIDNSNNDFEYWSDYLNVDYSGRSLIAIPDSLLTTTSNDANGDWNGLTFDDGYQLMESNYEVVSDLYQDNLRKMVEECDNLSGFQCLIDCDGVWGGVSTSILSHIQDEYSSKSIATFASNEFNQNIENNSNNEDLIDQRIYNTSKTIESIAPSNSTGLSDLYIPLSCEKWWSTNGKSSLGNWIKKTKYQTSAEIAASIDSSTLYFRSNYKTHSFSSFISQLTSTSSRKLCILSTSFPSFTNDFGFSYSSSKYGNEPSFPKTPLYFHPTMRYLSPGIISSPSPSSKQPNTNPLNEIISIRGIDIFKHISEEDRVEISNNYDKISSLFNMYLSNSYNGHGRSVLNRTIVNIVQPFIMNKNHFPTFSSPQQQQQQQQLLQQQQEEQHNDALLSIENPKTIITHLQNSNLIHPFIQYLNNGFKQITISKKMKRLIVDQDSFDETIEVLNYLSDNYIE